MVFGIDIEKIAKEKFAAIKAKIFKLDLNKNGIADVEEIEADYTAASKKLQPLLAKITPAEYEAALNFILPGKFSPEEVADIVSGAKGLYSAEQRLQALLLGLGVAL